MFSRSHPARGAWIEMATLLRNHSPNAVAPRPGCVDRNKPVRKTRAADFRSHPARGAWIEIYPARLAPNYPKSHPARGAWIEMYRDGRPSPAMMVAPRPGCVDRNRAEYWQTKIRYEKSHPARGAWIEIALAG